jgi:hypothetical protein
VKKILSQPQWLVVNVDLKKDPRKVLVKPWKVASVDPRRDPRKVPRKVLANIKFLINS